MFKITSKKAPAVSPKRKEELLLFQSENNFRVKDLTLLNNALTHSSYANESKVSDTKDNERLEFLGDSVLSISVSDWLYMNLSFNEGEYTKIRSAVVSEDSLAKVAEKLQLDKYLLIGRGEELTGGRHKKAILADCTEAVFAAIYLDNGMDYARKFILDLLLPEIKKVSENKVTGDYKTLLQEYVQKKYKTVPVYSLVSSAGPEHNPVFMYKVEFNNKVFGPEKGHNKKEAEQAVARLACMQIGLKS